MKLLTSCFFFSVQGFNPMWNENFQFDVYVPDLALVRFAVEHYELVSDNEFVGQYTLPFNSLKTGTFKNWRWIFLSFFVFTLHK